MLYALAMGACSMTYAVTLGHAALYAYRMGPCHTKARRLAMLLVRGCSSICIGWIMTSDHDMFPWMPWLAGRPCSA